MITIHQRHRQTDRQTTCDRNTALCTTVHRAVITIVSIHGHTVHQRQFTHYTRTFVCLAGYSDHVQKRMSVDAYLALSGTTCLFICLLIGVSQQRRIDLCRVVSYFDYLYSLFNNPFFCEAYAMTQVYCNTEDYNQRQIVRHVRDPLPLTGTKYS